MQLKNHSSVASLLPQNCSQQPRMLQLPRMLVEHAPHVHIQEHTCGPEDREEKLPNCAKPRVHLLGTPSETMMSGSRTIQQVVSTTASARPVRNSCTTVDHRSTGQKDLKPRKPFPWWPRCVQCKEVRARWLC